MYSFFVNLQTLVMIYCKTITTYQGTKQFYSNHWIYKEKSSIFILPKVKMNANYAEICIVGNLEADFHQVPLSGSACSFFF